ncbi:hypothetical protein LEMLEM_LOCUS24267, partial [Lemmus lemmus]
RSPAPGQFVQDPRSWPTTANIFLQCQRISPQKSSYCAAGKGGGMSNSPWGGRWPCLLVTSEPCPV